MENTAEKLFVLTDAAHNQDTASESIADEDIENVSGGQGVCLPDNSVPISVVQITQQCFVKDRPSLGTDALLFVNAGEKFQTTGTEGNFVRICIRSKNRAGYVLTKNTKNLSTQYW